MKGFFSEKPSKQRMEENTNFSSKTNSYPTKENNNSAKKEGWREPTYKEKKQENNSAKRNTNEYKTDNPSSNKTRKQEKDSSYKKLTQNLIDSVYEGNWLAAREALFQGASPDTIYSDSNPLIFLALQKCLKNDKNDKVEKDRVRIVKLLVECGANLNITSPLYGTALNRLKELAKEREKLEQFVKLFIKYGAIDSPNLTASSEDNTTNKWLKTSEASSPLVALPSEESPLLSEPSPKGSTNQKPSDIWQYWLKGEMKDSHLPRSPLLQARADKAAKQNLEGKGKQRE